MCGFYQILARHPLCVRFPTHVVFLPHTQQAQYMCVYYHTCVVFHYSDCDKNVKGGWEGQIWIGGQGGATSVIENFTKKTFFSKLVCFRKITVNWFRNIRKIIMCLACKLYILKYQLNPSPPKKFRECCIGLSVTLRISSQADVPRSLFNCIQ